MADAVTSLPIDQLQPNPFQPRDKIKKEDLVELVSSVKSYGILEPLVVAHTPAGYQIIAGERRWRAAKEAGLTDVPVVVKETSPRGMLEMALIENVQRTDLSAIERAQAFQQLLRDFKMTHSLISEKVGKSSSYVSNSLKLLSLPDAIKDGLVGGMITEGHARALCGIDDERSMIECYKLILKENASVRRAEDLVRRFREEDNQVVSGRVGAKHQVSDTVVEDWQKKLQSHLHTKSKLRLIRSARQTRVSITLAGTPEQTQADLERIIELVTSK